MIMNQTQQAFASTQKMNLTNASSKAFQYLQKKGNLHSNAQLAANGATSAENGTNQMRRIGSERKQTNAAVQDVASGSHQANN